ncbi:hypothetical protein [Burkholderia cenocepacia]|uniref:hypothetical protein n=1 Tax=Burkholderia cenocepacia TaxID=95486 RepID=UPI003F73679C
MIRREYNVFTMCSGLGGGAKGFQEAMSQVGEKVATWRCIGVQSTTTPQPAAISGRWSVSIAR